MPTEKGEISISKMRILRTEAEGGGEGAVTKESMVGSWGSSVGNQGSPVSFLMTRRLSSLHLRRTNDAVSH